VKGAYPGGECATVVLSSEGNTLNKGKLDQSGENKLTQVKFSDQAP